MSGQGGRYERSGAGMIGAMIAIGVLVVGVTLVNNLRSPVPANPAPTVDYRPVLSYARSHAPFDLVAPSALPSGWRATTVGFNTRGKATWHLGVLTTQGRYVGLEQSNTPVAAMVSRFVDAKPTAGSPVQVAGRRWQSWTDSHGDLALVRRTGRTTTLVLGHDVARRELVGYTASLR